jgi:hypothetical protein
VLAMGSCVSVCARTNARAPSLRALTRHYTPPHTHLLPPRTGAVIACRLDVCSLRLRPIRRQLFGRRPRPLSTSTPCRSASCPASGISLCSRASSTACLLVCCHGDFGSAQSCCLERPPAGTGLRSRRLPLRQPGSLRPWHWTSLCVALHGAARQGARAARGRETGRTRGHPHASGAVALREITRPRGAAT